MARIPLPTRDDLSSNPKALEYWDRTEKHGPILNVIRMYMNNPEMESQGIRAWKASGLSRRSRELVILRVAYRRQSKYEWHQHVRFCREGGIPDADINALKDWRSSTAFSADERALLAYVDAIIDDGRPSDEIYGAMAKDRTSAEILGVTYLITHYFSLSMIMEALDLETEEEFVGWDL